MIWCTVSPWRKLAYDLVYPAVLGSMLYDVLHWEALGSIGALTLAVALFYCVDWLYLYTDLRYRNKARWFHTALDIGIALSLGFAFHSAHDGHVARAYSFWFLASLGIFFYMRTVPGRGGWNLLAPGLIILLTGLGAFLHCYRRMGPCETNVLALAPLLVYGVFVFGFQGKIDASMQRH